MKWLKWSEKGRNLVVIYNETSYITKQIEDLKENVVHIAEDGFGKKIGKNEQKN